MPNENKNGVDNSYIIINETELSKTILNIESINDKISETESSITEELNNIKDTILIDDKTIYNKSYEIEQNFNTFRKNYNGSISVFNSLIKKYTYSVENAQNYIDQKIGEIE